MCSSDLPENKPSLKVIQEAIDTDEVAEKVKSNLNIKDLKDWEEVKKEFNLEISRNKRYQQVSGGGFNNIANSTGIVSTGLDTLKFTGAGVNSVTQSGRVVTVDVSGGGSGSPGGSNKQLQFNDSSSFGGANNTSWDKTTEVLSIGSGALSATFPNAGVIVSKYNSGSTEDANIGLMVESQATLNDATKYGYAIYGHGYTNGTARSGGVVGEGKVTNSSDGGSAIGVRGYASDTHAGGMNIGLYGNASGGSANYALYMTAGDIYSGAAQTWSLISNANALNISSGLLNINTVSNVVSTTGTLNSGALTDSQIVITDASKNLVSASTATYPSLTELSYVKGVTSAIQTQLDAKQGTLTLTTTGSSGAATLIGNTLNIPQYSGGSSGITRSISTVSTNTSAGSTALTDYVYFVSGTTTLTLPTAVGNTNRYTVKNVGSGNVTIATTGGQTIDGGSTATLNDMNLSATRTNDSIQFAVAVFSLSC